MAMLFTTVRPPNFLVTPRTSIASPAPAPPPSPSAETQERGGALGGMPFISKPHFHSTSAGWPGRNSSASAGASASGGSAGASGGQGGVSGSGTGGAYGYMWWVTRDGILFPNRVMPAGSFAAKGAGGHVVLVLPSLDTIIVHRVDTDRKGHSVSSGRIGRLIGRRIR
jgi:hypothetical protein